MNQFQLPSRRELFYGGGWHQAAGGTVATVSPSTGRGGLRLGWSSGRGEASRDE